MDLKYIDWDDSVYRLDNGNLKELMLYNLLKFSKLFKYFFILDFFIFNVHNFKNNFLVDNYMKDLHLHLSGATDPVLLFEIINETGLKLKNKNFGKFRDSL